MKILVTGGSGVVGVGTVTELVARGHSVVLLARHAAKDVRRWPHGVSAWTGDVTNAASILGAADGCEVILHMAAVVEESGEATFDAVNVRGTATVLAEARRAGVKRVVYVSSLGAPKGTSGYHQSKAKAERLVKEFDGHWVICRPGNVYGPGDEQISVLLRLVRGPSSIVPKIGEGDQPFQPIWWEDCAKALATVVERTDLAGRELDIAGEEVTCQNDLLERFSRITGREVHAIAVPEFLATLGAKAVSLVGWNMSFNEEQVTMLREGNVVPADGINALHAILHVEPTPLEAGLRRLATQQPEQLPSDGVGTLRRKRYWADITHSTLDADAMFMLLRTRFNDVTPVFVDAAAERHSDGPIAEGDALTLSLPMRGHVQVRVAELETCRMTLLTLQGHPLAGAVRFVTEPRGAIVRFQIEVFDRAANLLDLIAMRTLGDHLQAHTWNKVVETMIERSGGDAPDGVQHDEAILEEVEGKEVERWLEGVALRRARVDTAEQIDSLANDAR